MTLAQLAAPPRYITIEVRPPYGFVLSVTANVSGNSPFDVVREHLMESVMRLFPRFRRASIAAVAAATMIVGAGASGAHAASPTDGLVAQYTFSQTSGASVPNGAAGSSVGAATVRNLQSGDWTGTALRMRGGAKTSSGNWVELPPNLLSGKTSATVTAEVKASAAMLTTFHFLWNIGNESSATEYFFASLNCGSGRSPLVGIKSAGAEQLVSAGSCGVTADQWVNVTSVIDGGAGTAALYIDGVLAAQGPVGATPANVVDQSLNTIGRAPWPDPLFQGALSSFRVYDRALSAAEVAAVSAADAERNEAELRARAQDILNGLDVADRAVSGDIDLPTAAGRVTWTSSNPAVIAPTGEVTPPFAGQSDVTVELTATAAIRGISATRTVTITVQHSDESPADRIARLAQRFVVPPVVRSGAPLPAAPAGTRIEVASSSSGVTVADGAIVSALAVPVDSTIALRVRDTGTAASVTRTFAVRVLPATATELIAYDRTPTSEAEANNADVALSMHLALADGDGWRPLNENYGVFFAKTSQPVPANGPNAALLRSLRDPHLFSEPDGSFGIVATRTLRGGGAENLQSSSVLYARSADLLSYDEVGMIDLGVTSGVNDPAVVWDSASERYVVAWMSDAGIAMYTTFADLADPATRGPVQRGVVAAASGVETAGIASFASGNTIAVSDEVAGALEVRFGRIVNTGVAPFAAVEVEAGGELRASDLPDRAELSYNDGSTATRAVDWDADSLAAVDTDIPGTYEVSGTVKAPAYPTPFADERADPSVFSFDFNGEQKFLMIATEDLNLNPIDPANGAHMPFRIADRIEDLSDDAVRAGRNAEVDLLRAGDTDADGGVMTGCFWAPELHLVDDTLTIYFMPCYNGSNGRPDMWTGRASIIQLKKDAAGNHLDPAVAANWTKARKVLRADGSALNTVQNISLDMTYFEDSGQSYYSWQMLGANYIAKMNPADPTRLTSAPVRITPPEYAWDNTIAEGPNVLVHEGRIYMIYSGSTVGDTYTTGLMTATAGENVDLTDPAAWTKLNYPIQKSGMFNGAWQLGTGHGMWSEDEDGNILYVFHARTDNRGLTGRDMFVRRVHFASDGMPVFDMEADEEVASENRTVTVAVTVTAPSALEVTGTAATRCVAGKVVQTVTVRNAESVPVTFSLAGSYGAKTSVAVAAGKSSSVAFTTRQSSVAASTVTLSAEATVDGRHATSTSQLSSPAASCG